MCQLSAKIKKQEPDLPLTSNKEEKAKGNVLILKILNVRKLKTAILDRQKAN